jgi:hypothetical protein
VATAFSRRQNFRDAMALGSPVRIRSDGFPLSTAGPPFFARHAQGLARAEESPPNMAAQSNDHGAQAVNG